MFTTKFRINFKIIQLLRSPNLSPRCHDSFGDFRSLSYFVGDGFNNTQLGSNSAILSPTQRSSLNCCSLIQKRFKKKSRESGPQTRQDDDEVVSDTDELEDTEVVRNFKDGKLKVSSLRLDLVTRKVLKMTHSKFEAAFYDTRIRLNEAKVGKKNTELELGDEVDYIVSVSRDSPDLLNVSRFIMRKISLPDDDGNYVIKVRLYANLLVPNYPEPWTDGPNSSTSD